MPRPIAWIAAWAAALAALTLLAHPTPLYTVETDLIGEYVPAAHELTRGAVTAAHYTYKGPGYPALLALASAACGGDAFLAARLLSVASAAAAAWIAWALVAHLLGPAIAALALALLLVTPVFVRYAIEAGTDAPGLALMLAATLLVMRGRGVRAACAAGVLAGVAVLTRGNAVFLVLAGLATLALRAIDEGRALRSGDASASHHPLTESQRSRAGWIARWAPMAVYALAFAVPLAAWGWIVARAGAVIYDRNYLNVAYELYGRRLPWDEFERTIGIRFGSLAQVLAFDPMHAASRIGANLFVHRARDLVEMVPPWLGVLSLAGAVLLVRRTLVSRFASAAGIAVVLHVAGSALVLATVFYNPRFSLYLAPFYAAAAAVAVQAAAARLARDHRPAVHRAARLAPAALVLCGACVAVLATMRVLAEAPHEVRTGGRALQALSGSSDAVLARKPHVAYFAHRPWTPLPPAPDALGFVRAAYATGARWLFFSAVERTLRPELAVLADPAARLPGVELAAYEPGPHGYAIYRLTGAPLDSATFREALAGAVERQADRDPGVLDAQVAAALQLFQLQRYDRVLARLDALRDRGARDARTEQLRADAWLAVGNADSAAAACERSLGLAPPVASRWARLAIARARQGRMRESRACWERTVALEPASIAWLDRLGHAHVALREYAQAAGVFERCAALAPGAPEWPRFAMGAWQLAGDDARMQRVYQAALRAGIPGATLLGNGGAAAESR